MAEWRAIAMHPVIDVGLAVQILLGTMIRRLIFFFSLPGDYIRLRFGVCCFFFGANEFAHGMKFTAQDRHTRVGFNANPDALALYFQNLDAYAFAHLDRFSRFSAQYQHIRSSLGRDVRNYVAADSSR
jgi:hypothetical protein